MGRPAWVIQVGPVSSQGSSQVDEEAGAEGPRDATLLTLEMEEGPQAKEGRRLLEGRIGKQQILS